MSNTCLLQSATRILAAGLALAILSLPAAGFTAPDASVVQKEQAAMQGTWIPQEAKIGGQDFPAPVLKSLRLSLQGDRYEVSTGKAVDKGVVAYDPTTMPRSMSITGQEGPNKGKTLLAIYELNGDELKICYDLSGEKTPTEFVSEPATQSLFVKYRREKR
ncbi:MAG: TIGR03067 domain-containing protein [Pirellulales bacterium]